MDMYYLRWSSEINSKDNQLYNISDYIDLITWQTWNFLTVLFNAHNAWENSIYSGDMHTNISNTVQHPEDRLSYLVTWDPEISSQKYFKMPHSNSICQKLFKLMVTQASLF